jgi:hypothetical protein
MICFHIWLWKHGLSTFEYLIIKRSTKLLNLELKVRLSSYIKEGKINKEEYYLKIRELYNDALALRNSKVIQKI